MTLLPDIRLYNCPSRDEITMEFIVVNRAVRCPHRRDTMEAQAFHDDRSDVDKGRPVPELWETIRAYNRIKFFMRLPQDVWVES